MKSKFNHHPLLEFLLIFFFTYLLLLPGTDNFCHRLSHLDFDTHNLFVWDHLAEKGYQPYKDTFYPYGFLFFYKSQNLALYVLYTLIAPLLFSLTYLALIKRLFPRPLLKLLVYLSLLFITLNLLGSHAYSRYGLLSALGLFSAWLLYPRTHLNRRLILLGLISGVTLFASSGDGLYLVMLHAGLILFDTCIFFPLKPYGSWLVRLLKRFVVYGLGLSLGLIPLLGFLFQTKLLTPFLTFFLDMAHMTEYAKIHYFPDNIYEVVIIATFILSFVVALIRVYSVPLRRQYATYLLVTAWFSLFILLQKHLVRPIGQTIFFYAFILILILTGIAFKTLFSPKLRGQLLALSLYAAFIFSLISALSQPFYLSVFTQALKSYAPPRLPGTLAYSAKLCQIEAIDWTKLQLPPAYPLLKSYFHNLSQPYRLFSFPYDPLLYLYLNQKPAPYPNVYESAPPAAQAQNLKFLENEAITHVVYNLSAPIIDWSPEYVRTFATTEYLLNHFQPVASASSFIILQKTATPSAFFTPKMANTFPELYRHLTHITWGQIPLTQGQNFGAGIVLEANDKQAYSDTIALNQYLETNPQSTDNLILILSFQDITTPTGRITIIDNQDLKTDLVFGLKPHAQALFRLSRVPLFIQGGRLTHLEVDPPPATLWLIQPKEASHLW